MKKILLLILVFTFFLSCQKKEANFSDEMIEKLDVIDNGLPSYYGFLNLYVSTNNNEFTETNCDYLFIFYKSHYHQEFKTFKDFLRAVLNENFMIDKNIFKEKLYLKGFKLNPNIEKEYKNLGFDKFLKKFSEKTASKRTDLKLNKNQINEDEYLSVVYFLYKNRYDISRDCYIGYDYIVKREDYFKSLK